VDCELVFLSTEISGLGRLVLKEREVGEVLLPVFQVQEETIGAIMDMFPHPGHLAGIQGTLLVISELKENGSAIHGHLPSAF
jgi:hypothetical protein